MRRTQARDSDLAKRGPRPRRLGSSPAAQLVAAHARAPVLPAPRRRRIASWRRCPLGAHRLTAGPAAPRRSAWPWRTPTGAASWPSGAPRRWPSRPRRRRRRRGCRRARRPWRSACAPRSPTRRRGPSPGASPAGQRGIQPLQLPGSRQGAVGARLQAGRCDRALRRAQSQRSCSKTGLQRACRAPACTWQECVSSLGGCAAAGAPGERGGGALGQAGGRGGQGRRRARARGGGCRRARGRAR